RFRADRSRETPAERAAATQIALALLQLRHLRGPHCRMERVDDQRCVTRKPRLELLADALGPDRHGVRFAMRIAFRPELGHVAPHLLEPFGTARRLFLRSV